ncbi:MAG: hypothetical protein KGL39_26060 [Patescibacteria group bacterium]|nr:hypothetical protein [Patescibacteria group bacterium]
MISDSGIWYPDPIEKRIAPVSFARPRPLAVRARTWICDGRGKIIRRGQEVWNTITDYGMDLLATNTPDAICTYLVLSSVLGPAKKVLTGGTTLSITSVADPTNLAVVASANFFASGDVGNTLYIDGLGQELKITAYTDAQHVTCATRQSLWLPGISPTTGPFSTAGVHYTATNTVNTEITRFNTYDTSSPNYNTQLNDSANSRWIHQRIFLSGTAPGSWTINQLGWTPNSAANSNVFGKVNLITPDNVATGQKYRVQLDFYSGYTPINQSSVPVNWGATIGSYNLNIRQEVIAQDTSNSIRNFLQPTLMTLSNSFWWTNTFTLATTKWQGDAGYVANPHTGPAGSTSTNDLSDAAYTNGTFFKQRTWKFLDTIAISAATGLTVGNTVSGPEPLTIQPATGTITKPTGYWCALTFPIYWTRALTN